MLCVFGVGLALASYRPSTRRRGARSGPGHMAAAITAIVALSWALMTALDRWITPWIPLPPGTTQVFGDLLTSY